MLSEGNLRFAFDCFKINTNHNFDKSIFHQMCSTWKPYPISHGWAIPGMQTCFTGTAA